MGIDLAFPAWPMRVGCAAGLDKDLGVTVTGNVSDVLYSVKMGAFEADINWGQLTGR
jgi:hypothetical protein